MLAEGKIQEHLSFTVYIKYNCNWSRTFKDSFSVMVWAGITSTWEKTPLIFMKEGIKVNQHVCLDLLKNKLVPWINATFGEIGIILQQDGATSRTANRVQEGCKRNMTGFWPKELWPPSSPDLNPMYFTIWSILESKACSSNHPNIGALNNRLKAYWNEISEETVRAVNLSYVSGSLSRMCFHVFFATLWSTRFNGSMLFCSWIVCEEVQYVLLVVGKVVIRIVQVVEWSDTVMWT